MHSKLINVTKLFLLTIKPNFANKCLIFLLSSRIYDYYKHDHHDNNGTKNNNNGQANYHNKNNNAQSNYHN